MGIFRITISQTKTQTLTAAIVHSSQAPHNPPRSRARRFSRGSAARLR